MGSDQLNRLPTKPSELDLGWSVVLIEEGIEPVNIIIAEVPKQPL